MTYEETLIQQLNECENKITWLIKELERITHG